MQGYLKYVLFIFFIFNLEELANFWNSTTFYNSRKSFPRFFSPQFLPNESFRVINKSLFFFLEPWEFFYNNVTFLTRLRFYNNRKFSPLPIGPVYNLMVDWFQMTVFRKKFKWKNVSFNKLLKLTHAF
jgi:hypothetical protein